MKFKERLAHIYSKLINGKDTPHRIALGFSIGIFYGLFPFVGIIFTLVTAIIFKANKAAALIGCFVTNTWISVILLFPSIRIGSNIFGLDWRVVWLQIKQYANLQNIKGIFKNTSCDVLIPLLMGFFILAFSIAMISYVISLFFILMYRNRKAKIETKNYN